MSAVAPIQPVRYILNGHPGGLWGHPVIDGGNLVAWAIKLSSWCAIAVYAVKFRLPRRYPAVFCYITVHASLDVATSLITLVVATDTTLYLIVYILSSLATIGLAFVVLCQIYLVFGAFRLSRDWHLAVAPAVILAVTLSDSQFLPGIWTGSNVILTYLGLAVSLRMIIHRDVDLGWNLKMVLFAIAVPASLYSLVLVDYFATSKISYESLSIWTRWTWIGSWIVLAVGLSEYSPPRGPGWELARKRAGKNAAVDNDPSAKRVAKYWSM